MCSTHGWSILHSAPSNATLAGVLAGFAFTAGVIYVGRSIQVPDESEHVIAHLVEIADRHKVKIVEDAQRPQDPSLGVQRSPHICRLVQ
jgi:hypothetical protein